MRQRRPESKYSMQYDKLIIDHEIYMFNDMTGRVEEVSQSIQNLDFKNRNLMGDSQVTHLLKRESNKYRKRQFAEMQKQ